MGTEDNVKQALRSTNKFRCDICGRRFSTETALTSHQATVHRNAINRKRNLKASFKAKIVKKAKPKLFLKSKEIATPGKSLPTNAIVKINEEAIKISRDSVVDVDDAVSIEDKIASKRGKILATDEKSTKFKCPHCEKSFNMLFPLKMHIARDHGKNNGTPDKIVQAKPSTMSKEVAVSDKEDDNEYMCVGCKANFLNLGQFYSHMDDVHSEGKDTLYFPTISEFETWREDMQRKLRLKYTTEHKLDDSNSMHTCPRKVLLPSQCIGKNVTVLCPSMILMQKSSEGCTVCFFKQHFGHDSRKYVLADKFKKYNVITPVKVAVDDKQKTENSSPVPRIGETEVKPEVDKLLYDKFKSIMEGIVKDAVKLDESGLKTFIDRALQMSSALTSYASNVCKVVGHLADVTMTPVKVVKSFDEDLNEPKSKVENIEIKTEPSENKTVETIDLSVDDSMKTTLVKKVSEVPKISVKSNSKLMPEEIKSVVESQKVMTQTVSSKVFSPIFDASSSKTNITSNKVTSSNNELTLPKSSPTIITGSPVSDKKTNKVAPMTIASPIKVAKDEQVVLKKRKIVMKTKMGQFIPNSPKRIKSSTETNSPIAKEITNKRNNLNSIKYKVIEQENDCNILVLKF